MLQKAYADLAKPGAPAEMKRADKGLYLVSNPGERMDEFIEDGSKLGTPAELAIMLGDTEQLTKILVEHEGVGEMEEKTNGDSSTHLSRWLAGGAFPMISIAARHGQVGCGEVLLDYRADVDAQVMEDGQRAHVGTPLMISIEEGHHAFAMMMLRRGANPNAMDPAQNTPSHLATLNNSIPLLEEVKLRGGDISAPNVNARTPLHQAVRLSEINVTKWLIANQANLNAQDRWGETALHVALVEGNKPAAHELLNVGGICAQKCKQCQLHTKLVTRAVGKSNARKEEKKAVEEFEASVTEEEIKNAAAVCKTLMEEEEMLRQQLEEQQKKGGKKTKGKNKASRGIKEQLAEIQDKLRLLRVHAAPGQVVDLRPRPDEKDFENKFNEAAADNFMKRLGVEDFGTEESGDGDGLTPEEIRGFIKVAEGLGQPVRVDKHK